MAAVHQSNDTAWKEILEAYFKDFIELCLPDLDKLIDWRQPWESLDKELLAITKDGATGKRVLDKLFRVYFTSGQEQWVLIHLEVQGQVQVRFPRRMLIYGYRLYDKYQKPIVSCAILTDQNANWRPDHYEIAVAGSRLRMDFRVVKLLDYADREVELEHSSNPFASVILSYLAALQIKQSPEELRLQMKLTLTKRLYRKGYTKEQIIRLYLFIDWVIHLLRALEIEYQETVYHWEVEEKMAYISTIERFGIQKGLQKGLQQGFEQGLQKGKQEGEYMLLLKLLQRKFHVLPAVYCQKLEKADAETLLKWGERLLDADALEEIFQD
ncbi:hypothetical protein AYM02_01680 [Coxiella burnetii]|uniref:DUF4351 domain-containing protein n=1 Tax=Coxiella burnetii TaxID=777 RepID=UPI00031A4C4A|nr:DUF4351 domain-containing protein [Coxiella burnetii]AML48079.1 hypothetical protein AUR58_01975 [Coxiella burnetii]AML54102.1 hypothetical protein AYM38_01655 [Coxiella burnetii]ATN68064.1 hypothetical protein AYM00_01705 [Coxiella burnetii]ATN69992.1 hypothetical protein AYM02_01680 [Coxiella burnetii]ATN71947.1 hypothetical protein AYM11_01630 [Coxiella burnetii]